MTLTQFQSKIDAICSCMEQESREQMVKQLYQEQVQPLQGNTDFNLAISTCANSIHINYGGVTSKRELIEEVLRRHFEPLVKRLEQQLKNSGELFVEFHNLARPSFHSNPTLAIKHALTEYKSLLAKVQSLTEYAQATQYWKIEPHDQKERAAFLAKLLLPILTKDTNAT